MYQNWKNPSIAAKRKRTPTLQRTTKNTNLPIPQKQETKSMKDSLIKVREQVRGAREQLQQMESTIETLYNVMDAVERFGAGGKKGKSAQSGLLKSFQNIDFKQVMNLLQSPLVQALVETMAEDEDGKKK